MSCRRNNDLDKRQIDFQFEDDASRNIELSVAPERRLVEVPKVEKAAEHNAVSVDEPVLLPAQTAKVVPRKSTAQARHVRPNKMEIPLDFLNESERVLYVALSEEVIHRSAESASLPDGLVQIGYSGLRSNTTQSNKTTQRAIKRLIQKGFIQRAFPANTPQGASAVYRVIPEEKIAQAMQEVGLTHWIKCGGGRRAVPAPKDYDLY